MISLHHFGLNMWAKLAVAFSLVSSVWGSSESNTLPNDGKKLTFSHLVAQIPLIVDTDGSVDDVFALAMLLNAEKRGEVKVLGVTTVGGTTDVNNATNNVLKLLFAADRLDIPVYRGAYSSIEMDQLRVNQYGLDGFGDIAYPHPEHPSTVIKKEHAVFALINLAAEHSGKLVMMCLGPLTNYALAARLDHKFSSRLAQLVVMGGAVNGMGNVKPGVEFNFYWDPMAAFITFYVPQPHPVIVVPWETAVQAAVPRTWRQEELGKLPGDVMLLLNKAEDKFFQRAFPVWVSADLLTASLLVRPSLARSAELHFMNVETHAARLSGAALVDRFNSMMVRPNVKIVSDVDVEAYKAFLLDYLKF